MNNSEANSFHRPVIVVGAGPVGMTAALALRRHGIPATILEAEPEGRMRPGSRAIYIHKATLKLLEEISPGLGFKLAQRGLVWPLKRTLFRGKEVYRRVYATPDPKELPPFTSLPQTEIEAFMLQACKDAGVEFVWNTPVSDVKTDDRRVTIATETGQVWTAEYVVGADGSRSVVRKSLGIKMEGARSPNAFVVVDVKEDPDNPLPLERIFHYQHPAMGGRNVLYVPFTGGWRIDLQLFEGDDPDDFSSTEGVKAWLRKVFDPKYAERITWVSTYQFLQVVAEEFTDPNYRVLLAGESCHLFAPFGARGLNSGVPDAVAAVKAINTALNAREAAAGQQAVMIAADKRKKAAMHNRANAGVALNHLQGNSFEMRVKRYWAAALAPMMPKLGRWLDEGPYGPKAGPSASSKY
ncbi:FAD-dependent monooxygenase [Ferviditalea candida]|uniref:FAD-dependent monooxygenase n=1 Tax=Ferviditalea candida TaxID=3108399 RepID=A0ABU5ZED8_9BACL|nr:FAD-dependent monooxygenase [Paenibacillaceae bacterium T2]